MTKSFQSIRQLMARVLGKSSVDAESQREYSTLGLEPSANGAQSPVSDTVAPPGSSVFVEAPMMTESGPLEGAAAHCSTDVEMQTADTMQLHPVDAALAVPKAEPQSDLAENEIESEPVSAANPASEELPFSGASQMNEPSNHSAVTAEPADHFGDAFLELGDFHNSPSAGVLEDSILDLEGESSASVLESPSAVHISEAPAALEETEFAAEPEVVEFAHEVAIVPAPIEQQEWASVPEAAVEEVFETAAVEEVEIQSGPGQINRSDLSPEAVDAIARRVIAQMSDKVVREIAWEVVPELAELLIKEKLEEQG